ncbi:MAG: 3-methyl-2-oxobutanoate hydroxymethyltransferase [Phycisphaeraceae bacterium]|nr:3-methyl-2-oxobutanoate hydroxymethyltransferase [Phycisphaeraceae bacterium]MCW5763567.1 3-methyl-2-oxobutanoate hydroxymethyltransferase [Phycisphaeraceae bacterium]
MSVNVEPTGPRRVTLRTLRQMAARREPFACLAAYDATMARWLDRAGVHVLLAGDSAAQVVLGYDRTTDMPLEIMIALTAALRRGASQALVMADMPFMSYHASDASAMRNAGRFMTEGQADVVKLEVDAQHAGLVRKLSRAGIPVCAHVGLRPQMVAMEGQYRAAGRTAKEAAALVRDAMAMEDAGAALLLVEAVPEAVSDAIMAHTSLPLIGIGAGAGCHGQILVVHDLLGLSDVPPRFAVPVLKLGEAIRDAASMWVQRVAAKQMGGEGYGMLEGELAKLSEAVRDALIERNQKSGPR